MLVISGDIGGTSTRMQFTEFTAANDMKIIANIHYSNNNYGSFADIITAFFQETKMSIDKIAGACFGVAGPVVKGKVNITNLPWVINTRDIKNQLKLDKVELINDFASIGHGLEILQPKDMLTLQVGKPRPNGIRAYIGAGTGLGVGFMTCYQGQYLIHSTEGGHIDFAPTDDLQIELLRYMRKKYHRVSFERLLSGQGLINIYAFVRDNKIFGEEENPNLRFLIKSSKHIDVAATIAEYAIKHKDIMAMRALNIFIGIYGSAVGNLALTTLPFAGLYVVSGIAPKLLKEIEKGNFYKSFLDKGRMSHIIKDVPLHIVLYQDVGLQGTAICAKKLVG